MESWLGGLADRSRDRSGGLLGDSGGGDWVYLHFHIDDLLFYFDKGMRMIV
jgi:hypothetical protein